MLSEKELKRLSRLLNLKEDAQLSEFETLNELEDKVSIHEEKITELTQKVVDGFKAEATLIRSVEDEFLSKLNTIQLTPGDKGDKGERGATGTRGQKGQDGKDGYTPIKDKDYFDGVDGEKGEKGERGDKGETGKTPKHEWKKTKLRFENPDGTWGEFVNLKGDKGEAGTSYSLIARSGGGGSGTGDVSAAGNNSFSGTNTFLQGIILKSANGTSFVLGVDNDGALTTTNL